MKGTDRLKKTINNISLQNKIISVFIGSILIIIIVFSLALKVITNINHQMLYNSIASSLAYSSHEINGILLSVEDSSMQIFSDALIQDNLSTIKTVAEIPAKQQTKTEQAMSSISRKNIYSLLTNYLHNNSYISYISIINEETSVTANTYPSVILQDSQLLAHMIEEARARQGKSIWFAQNDGGLYLVRTIREIEGFSLKNLGTLIIQVDMERLIASATSFSSLFEESNIILSNDNEVIYSMGELKDIPYLELFNRISGYEIIDLQHEKYFMVNRQIKEVPLNFTCLVPYNQVFYPMISTYLTALLITMLTIGLVIFFSVLLIRNITKHFHILIQKMDAFRGKGNLQSNGIYDYTDRMDELGLIHRHFDHMAAEIEILINENYLKQLHVKEAQIKALETQINPHFLYNTLNTINWRAKLIGEQQISEITEALSNLLRTALKEDSGIHTIEKELALVQSYIVIQQFRFGARLHFHQQVDTQLVNVPIPKMTIQPLVENAIKYSVEVNMDESNIYIEITAKDDMIHIYVKNDGSQFDEHPYDKKPEGSGIGLVNINSRIKLTFGEEYGLVLYNEDELAVAQITIPLDPQRMEC